MRQISKPNMKNRMAMIRMMIMRRMIRRKKKRVKIIAGENLQNPYSLRIGGLSPLSLSKDQTRDPYREIKANLKILEKEVIILLLIREMLHHQEIKRKL